MSTCVELVIILTISTNAKNKIFDLLISKMNGKIDNYSRETTSAPFHDRLLGKGVYDQFSYVQSLNTTLGMSIWEQIAVIICKDAGGYAERQYHLQGTVNSSTDNFIRNYMNELKNNRVRSDKLFEIEEIRKMAGPGALDYSNSVVDLFLSFGDREEYIDITSVKPNKKEFQAMKEKLLYWTAMRLGVKSDADVMTRLAMPYNPYDPEPYSRWTDGGLYDLSNGEILVGREFWDHVGQGNVYDDLLDIFSKAGELVRKNLGKGGY